jgi:hypothetical protein
MGSGGVYQSLTVKNAPNPGGDQRIFCFYVVIHKERTCINALRFITFLKNAPDSGGDGLLRLLALFYSCLT